MAKRTVSNTHEDFTPGSLDVILPTSCRSSKTVAQRHGVTFAFGNTNYSPGAFRVRLEAKRDGGDKRDFEEYAASCGLNPADFGAFFTCQNRKYTVSGINPGSRAYPIVTTREDGQCINFSEHIVREALKAKAGRSNDARNPRLEEPRRRPRHRSRGPRTGSNKKPKTKSGISRNEFTDHFAEIILPSTEVDPKMNLCTGERGVGI